MKKSVIISAIIMAIIAAHVFFIAPLAGKRTEMKELLQVKYASLRKYETFLKSTGSAETELDAAVKEVEALEANAFQDKNESLAFAKMQGYVQDMAEKSGIKILSIKPLSVVKYKHYADLPIQLEASGGIIQLGEFLKQTDASKQLIRIDRLSIGVMNIQTPGELKIRIQVSGLMKV
ncbi:MAG: type 4a pilus biogenesis protein PilO [Nitrospirota bacterium]